MPQFAQIGWCMGSRWFKSQRQATSLWRWRQLPKGECQATVDISSFFSRRPVRLGDGGCRVSPGCGPAHDQPASVDAARRPGPAGPRRVDCRGQRARQALLRRVQRGDVREPPLRAPPVLNGWYNEPLYPPLGLGGVGREPRAQRPSTRTRGLPPASGSTTEARLGGFFKNVIMTRARRNE